MLRIGLIGAGRRAQIGHVPALQALHDHYRVVAIADQSPEALERTGILLAVPPEHRYTDYRDMLLYEELDIADIAVPHAFHYEAALAALRAGAHLITECPLALSVRDAEEILRVAETRGKQVTVLHYLLHYPPFQEGVRLMRAGAIGEPFLLRCEGVTGNFGPGTASYHPAWHADRDIAGGGVWLDSGYHAAYLCVSLAGSPVASVAARIDTRMTDQAVDDTAVVLLYHGRGAVSSVQVAWSVPSGGQRVFEIYGTEGTLSFDHEGYALGVFDNATHVWQHPTITFGHNSSYLGIFTAIAECLQHGAPPPVTHRDALHTLEVITAGYRAAASDAVVNVAL